MTVAATHTRESELREILAQESSKVAFPERHGDEIALACMRRISAPVPLTPSDEMVEAALKAYYPAHFWGGRFSEPELPYRENMRQALQAALNLMGGKK